MRSRRFLGFSAEIISFTRNNATTATAAAGASSGGSALQSQRLSLAHAQGYSRANTRSRYFQTSSFRPQQQQQSIKVSPAPPSQAPPPPARPTRKEAVPNASNIVDVDIDVDIEQDVVTPVLPLSHQFRNLMRLLTHSVVVCTSTHLPTPTSITSGPPGEAGVAIPRAMTMSSFTSLALHPTPAVSFNIATPSRTLDAIKSSGLFNIHVLAADVSGAKVANWCRQGNEGTLQLFQKLREECQCDVTLLGGEDTTNYGPAMLQGPGVLHILRCRLLDDEDSHGGLVKVRDHVIVLGEVLEIVDGGGGQDDDTTDADTERVFGLAYADTKYREPGKSIRTDRLEAGIKKRK